jgi:hypothetical protein
MARRTKDAPGRVTPKGGAKSGRVTPRAAPAASGRYTPPVPKEYKESPRWFPFLLLGLLLAGMAIILLNYLGVLPGGAKNAYLLVGLGFITVGFIAATRYR